MFSKSSASRSCSCALRELARLDRQRLLDDLGIGDLALRKPARLSTGQAQRVAIARALVHQPTLLLADEPTSSLDDANGQRAMGLLREHARAVGAALLVVSHDQRLRGQFDRELVLETSA